MTLQSVDMGKLKPGDTVHVKLEGGHSVWLTLIATSTVKCGTFYGVHTNASSALLDPRSNTVEQHLRVGSELLVNNRDHGKIMVLSVNP